MKSKEKIEQNLIQKIAGVLAGYGGERIKEHIIMLDWVLNDGMIRGIEVIIKDYTQKLEGKK